MKRAIGIGAALLLLPLLVRLLLAQSPPPSQAPPPPPTYTLTDLGPMTVSAIDTQNARGGPTALNSNAQVAGYRLNLSFNDQPIGFLWNNGIFTDLGTGGGPQSWAYGINNAGQIVGSSNFPGDLTGNSSRAFLWQNGVMTNLDPDPNFWSRAYAINANGDVAGFVSNGPVLPVIWRARTGRVMLPSLPCSLANCQGEALAINDLGQAAGWSVGGSVNVARPVMWDTNGQPTGLIPNPGYYTEANGINNSGVVVGYYQPQGLSSSPIHAFSWQSGTLIDLGTVGSDTHSGAWGINTRGDIVGISATSANAILVGPTGGGRAFLDTGGQMYDLSALLAPGTNWSLDTAFAINDSGQIVGTGVAPDRTEHGYLLTPVIISTTTSLSASVDPSVSGQQLSFTATVTPTQSSALTPTGNVTFSDGTTVLGTVPLSSGSATFNAGTLGVGSHTISASYAGDNNFGSSTSTALIQTVSPATTTATLVASPNPSNLGQTVTLMATVTVVAPGSSTPTEPTGPVTFSDGTTTLGSALLNGAATATFSTSSLASGSHSITATYRGDANFSGSTTSSSVTVTAQGPPPPVQITDNEAIHVADAESFPDVFDTDTVKVTDAVTVTPLINLTAPVAEFSAGSLGFSGQSESQTITVSDIGLASLTLASAAVSGSSQFAVTQISCTNSATSLSTVLPSGGVCAVTIGYTASAMPANDNGLLTFTDNAALSNLPTVASGSNYTQFIPLNGSGTSTAPPPPPPAVVPIMDNETITVNDTASFPDVFDQEAVRVTDTVFVTPLANIAAPVAEFSAASLGFSGQSGSQTITVSDIGLASLILASATISGSAQFAVTQISCTNSATSLSTVIPSGGVCAVTIGYNASAMPANDNATLTFTDNAALSNLPTVASGSNYTQSIPLNGSGSSTPPPPPPPAVVPITDNETITVNDAVSFPDVFDAEAVHVTDAVFVTPLINVGAPVADYSAGSLGFGNVAAGQTGTQSLTVSDIGQAPLTLSSAVVSQGSAFVISKISCSNGTTALPTTLPVGGACVFLISYLAASSGTASNDTLMSTDNAALSNVASVQTGASYTQSIALNGAGASTPPPPPPPAIVPIMDNETITVTDAVSFPDVFDSETITVSDQVTVKIISSSTTTSISAASVTYGTAATAAVSVSSSGGTVTGIVTLSVDGGPAASLPLSGGSAPFSLGVLSAGGHNLAASFAAQGAFDASAASGTVTISQASSTVTLNCPATPQMYTGATQTPCTAAYKTSDGLSGALTVSYTNNTNVGTAGASASYAGDANHAGSSGTASFTISQASSTVTLNCPATPQMYTGAAQTPCTAAYKTSDGLSGALTVSYTNNTIVGTATASASYTGDANHARSSGTGSFTIIKANQTITLKGVPASANFGQGPFTLSASATSGLAVALSASGNCLLSSNSLTLTAVGSCTVTAMQPGNSNYNAAPSLSPTFAIGPTVTTTNVSVSPGTVQYSDYTTLNATVSATSAGGQALTGIVQFYLNGKAVGSPVAINASGVATLSQVQVNLSAGNYTVKAVFSSANPNFAGNTGTTTQNVTQENAFILYSGDTIAQVGTSLNLRATVWDSAAMGYPGVNPESGSTATIGDITKIWIAFDIYPAGSCGSGTPSSLYAQVALTGAAGIGTAATTLNSSSEVSYCVVSRLVAGSTGGTNLFYTAPNAQAAGLDFYMSSGQFATGGGWVNDPTGSHGNFGFNARYNSTGSPKGQIVYVYRALYNGVVADFIIKSNAMSGLQFTGTTYPISSTLQGKANVQVNRASDGLSLFSAGNYTFSATVTDSGQSGVTGKQLSLSVYDSNGVPYHQVSLNTPLQGGNVVVHSH